MNPPAISVQNLGKMYRLNHQSKRADSLRDALTSTILSPWLRLRGLSGTDETMEEFWALKDVSFDVQPGEVLGIIGRNGAGKSTLLKVLSRIVEPTKGKIKLRGRVASLLEVGTGFHPELTGRENIYLNGSILGMKRREISRSFDEIVAFAEVERFLDTPVKRYSSGMYVRLAFAVAAHLDPEILIVDEVLAVGDSEFQKKCMGKMKQVATGTGRTVFFVSHNMAAIESLCTKCILLSKGVCGFIGAVPEAIGLYLTQNQSRTGSSISLVDHPARRAGSDPLMQSVDFLDSEGRKCSVFSTGEKMTVQIDLISNTPIRNLQVGIGVESQTSTRVFSVATYLTDDNLNDLNGHATVTCTIDSVPLVPGIYYMSLSAGPSSNLLMDAIDEAVSFEIVSGDFYGNGRAPSPSLGHVAIRSKWTRCNRI